MKNANMGRLGGLLEGKEKGHLRTGKCAVIPECCSRESAVIKISNDNNGSPTKFLGNDNHGNNRSRIKTLRDDDDNNGSRNPAGRFLRDDDDNNGFPCALHCYHTLGADNKIKSNPERAARRVSGFTACVVSRGFTLIELLVVVLIIGILAAYAVPSYRVAVGTSRATTMYALIRSVDQAQEHFYMQTGHYASNLDSLIVAIPAGFKKSDETIIYSTDVRCWIMNTRGAENFSFNCSSKDNVRIEKYHKQSFYICWAPQTNDLANRICQNLSGLDTYNNASSDGTTSYAYQIK